MKSLYIDIGNTSIKMAEKIAGSWKITERVSHINIELLANRINDDYGKVKIVCCSVRKDVSHKLFKLLKCDQINLLESSSIPQKMLNYETPETLGIDRFLVCLAANHLSEKYVIVIDSGSACTVDLMDEKGIYQGGAILPGLSNVEKHFKEMLPELPLPNAEIPEKWPGKSTKECVQWGVYGGYIAGIEKYIDLTVREIQRDFQLYICGGDADKIKRLLSDKYSIIVEPNLLFMGMEIFEDQII